jgi:hypothetical protein
MLDLTPWPDAVAPVRKRFGELIDAACRWHIDRDNEVDPDLFALVCAASLRFDEDGPASHLAPLVWTRIGMRGVLWAGFPNWCAMNSATMWPLEAIPATWQWLDFLHHTGRLDPRSDPLWELRKPLICYGGLDFDGRPRPEDDPSPIPCECYLPYRKTANYLNAQLKAGSLHADVLFDDVYSEKGMFEDGLSDLGADEHAGDGDRARVDPLWTNERGGGRRARGRARPARRRKPARPRRDALG